MKQGKKLGIKTLVTCSWDSRKFSENVNLGRRNPWHIRIRIPAAPTKAKAGPNRANLLSLPFSACRNRRTTWPHSVTRAQSSRNSTKPARADITAPRSWAAPWLMTPPATPSRSAKLQCTPAPARTSEDEQRHSRCCD